jgi:hypothetical protein
MPNVAGDRWRQLGNEIRRASPRSLFMRVLSLKRQICTKAYAEPNGSLEKDLII